MRFSIRHIALISGLAAGLILALPHTHDAHASSKKATSGLAGSIVPASVVSVYDGDTLTVDAFPWPGQTQRTSVRINGIDTAEMRGKCPLEKEKARAAKARTIELAGDAVTLVNIHLGKYAGRVVASVILQDGRDLATVLIDDGFARPYSGKGARKSWCHLASSD
ncbi:MAG: thermonuclease family protein [Parvibaculaceae bacterium]|nr:thermonuclease family protein [Parvibaculaceae bacterium]